MVTHPVLENKDVRDWLGDIMPVWTLLDERSFFALHHPPSRDDAAIQIATNLTRDEINISPISCNALLLLNRPGFVGGSNFQIGWSCYEQNDEQILP